MTSTSPGQGLWPSGWYFGDGSGGAFGSIPQLTRCGIGICAVGEDHKTAFTASTPLGGPVQTVARAEAFALLIVCQFALDGADLDYVGAHVFTDKDEEFLNRLGTKH